MAIRLRFIAGLSLVLVAAIFTAGCGVKAPPTARSEIKPAEVMDMTAEVEADGVRVSFTVPEGERPSQAIELVKLYYGYLPLGGNPDCPPCPPKLTEFHQFNLKAQTPQTAKLMEGGRFAYLDTDAPMNKQSVYRVVLIDLDGRISDISAPVRAYRVGPAAAPAGLKAKVSETEVELEWQEVTTMATGAAAEDIVGYFIWRTSEAVDPQLGPQERQLNMAPLKELTFIDKTVRKGKNYAYKVQAVRKIEKTLAGGNFSETVNVMPKDTEKPAPPEDMRGISQEEGAFISFSPSPDKDVEGYVIYRKLKGPDSSWVQISQELIVDKSYTDSGAEKGETYLYRVQAIDSSGNASEFSEVVEIGR